MTLLKRRAARQKKYLKANALNLLAVSEFRNHVTLTAVQLNTLVYAIRQLEKMVKEK